MTLGQTQLIFQTVRPFRSTSILFVPWICSTLFGTVSAKLGEVSAELGAVLPTPLGGRPNLGVFPASSSTTFMSYLANSEPL